MIKKLGKHIINQNSTGNMYVAHVSTYSTAKPQNGGTGTTYQKDEK